MGIIFGGWGSELDEYSQQDGSGLLVKTETIESMKKETEVEKTAKTLLESIKGVINNHTHQVHVTSVLDKMDKESFDNLVKKLELASPLTDMPAPMSPPKETISSEWTSTGIKITKTYTDGSSNELTLDNQYMTAGEVNWKLKDILEKMEAAQKKQGITPTRSKVPSLSVKMEEPDPPKSIEKPKRMLDI